MIITKHKELTFVAMTLTAIWYVFAFSWSFDSHLIRTIQEFLLSIVIAFVPYFIYLWLLKRYQDLLIVKWISLVILIAVQILLFVSVRISHERGGWEYIIIPFLQTVVALISMFVFSVFTAIKHNDE